MMIYYCSRVQCEIRYLSNESIEKAKNSIWLADILLSISLKIFNPTSLHVKFEKIPFGTFWEITIINLIEKINNGCLSAVVFRLVLHMTQRENLRKIVVLPKKKNYQGLYTDGQAFGRRCRKVELKSIQSVESRI